MIAELIECLQEARGLLRGAAAARSDDDMFVRVNLNHIYCAELVARMDTALTMVAGATLTDTIARMADPSVEADLERVRAEANGADPLRYRRSMPLAVPPVKYLYVDDFDIKQAPGNCTEITYKNYLHSCVFNNGEVPTGVGGAQWIQRVRQNMQLLGNLIFKDHTVRIVDVHVNTKPEPRS